MAAEQKAKAARHPGRPLPFSILTGYRILGTVPSPIIESARPRTFRPPPLAHIRAHFPRGDLGRCSREREPMKTTWMWSAVLSASLLAPGVALAEKGDRAEGKGERMENQANRREARAEREQKHGQRLEKRGEHRENVSAAISATPTAK